MASRLAGVALLGVMILTVPAKGAETTEVETKSVAKSQATGKLVTTSWNLCEFQTDLDGQWQGSLFASDGKCYFASSTHSGRASAMVFRFDPKTEKVMPLTPKEGVNEICGEDIAKYKPQGKIHSDAMEVDGVIYFATHLSYYYPKPGGEYTGSHVVGYDMKQGTWRHFGPLLFNYSNYSGFVTDPKRKQAYVWLTDTQSRSTKPSYLYRIDLATGKFRRVGTVTYEDGKGGFSSSVAHMFCDDDGNVWFALRGGMLMKYDPEADKLVQVEQIGPQMRWCEKIPGKNLAAVSMDGGRKLGIFDPAAPTGKKFREVANVGQEPAYWTLGTGGEVVYMTTLRRPRLLAVNLFAAKPVVVDYGQITDQDGRRPKRLPAIAADAEGGVYLTGDWTANEGDVQTTRLRVDKRDGVPAYPLAGRSQRFAYVQVARPSAAGAEK